MKSKKFVSYYQQFCRIEYTDTREHVTSCEESEAEFIGIYGVNSQGESLHIVDLPLEEKNNAGFIVSILTEYATPERDKDKAMNLYNAIKDGKVQGVRLPLTIKSGSVTFLLE